MATLTKGQENLEAALATCQQVQAALASAAAPEAQQAYAGLAEVVQALEGVREKFFLKTQLSVPPTRACKTEAAALASLVGAQQWAEVPAALGRLQKATQTLVTKAKMDGTTIT
ncbi:MAG: hypothetical protein KatS3mg131_0915 [Candidatus Tectimicrobiota bacterium]|nr:MAG: hypothetical protein KatS3mg131_0915 [Candidatus Tectomicrobia bacterium]